VWVALCCLGFGLYGETHDIRYGFFSITLALVVVWSMAVHPRADTPEGPFVAKRWVRWTVTVIAAISLMCGLGVAIFYSSWRPPAG
jgi:hypothetical protein